MYEVIKNVVTSGRYELSDMLKKIDTVWIQGGITEDQRDELVASAREKADPAYSYASLQDQVDKLLFNQSEMGKAILEIADRVTVLEGGSAEPPETEEYPAYVQPTGAYDAYNTGDKVTYNGKRYVCQMDGCVWDPDVYPAGWEETE
ncbi:MAG: hypothetical protein Q4C58_16070 [Eubacteriales bacterium]|nr:hypothetical protein [Eubacteriales bacterium]